MRQYSLRLQPGSDLKQSILDLARRQSLRSAVIICAVGSLETVRLRLTVIRGKPVYKKMNGDFEIVSVQGTVAKNGESAHIHLAVSDVHGHAWGGHLIVGCRVKTTVELVLLTFADETYRRLVDPATGFRELVVTKK